MHTHIGNPLKRNIDSLECDVQHLAQICESKTKQIAPSFRYNIKLSETNENIYPEYNYSQILDLAQKEHKVQKLVHDESNGNEVAEEVLDISRYYQKKYGHQRTNEVTYSNGYDMEDPFIDDSDVRDDNMPDDFTNGKFHVNTKRLKQDEKAIFPDKKCTKARDDSKRNISCRDIMKMKESNKKKRKAPTLKVKSK